MENKINVAELLRDCPQGMELDCLLWDNVTFERVADGGIWIKFIDSKNGERLLYVYNDGSFPIPNLGSLRTRCVIFPKGKTTWKGFVPPCEFKNGDVVVDDSGAIFIYKQIHPLYNKPYADFYCGLTSEFRSFVIKAGELQRCGEISSLRYATNEEKQLLFDTIKKHGYNWNLDTKTLSKLPKFKIGDTVTNGRFIIEIVHIDKTHYYDNTTYSFSIESQDEWKLVKKPTFKKGDKVKHKESGIYCTVGDYAEGLKGYHTNIGLCIADKDINDWELIPNKFDISKLKPFDKVLVRDFDSEVWEIDFFSRLLDGKHFKCHGASYVQCIPYKGNEHLSGKTYTCSYFYKTWEQD